ncbi:STAS domain-containing protein [Thalassolituus sp. LLYu03]|uniref:STAS domain-containing protein n=1 Tax=Thalassolituus sp. LLYu03 TaxID=3421656 RepID=UPI003D2D69F2
MAQIKHIDDHLAEVQGDLLLGTVTDLLTEGNNLLARAGGQWTVSLAGVGQVSSAGVALLLEWMRTASRLNVQLSIRDLPEHMKPIINISDLDGVFESVLA